MTATLPLSAQSHASDVPEPNSVPSARPRGRAVPWEDFGVLSMVLLSALLNIVWLDREAYGNTYYAAAVKSMLTSWPEFFFAAFDGGGQ